MVKSGSGVTSKIVRTALEFTLNNIMLDQGLKNSQGEAKIIAVGDMPPWYPPGCGPDDPPGGGPDVTSKMSSHQQLRVLVEQLQREASMERMKTSEAINQLKRFISEHEADDYLLVGFSSQKANPFREKSSCTLL